MQFSPLQAAAVNFKLYSTIFFGKRDTCNLTRFAIVQFPKLRWGSLMFIFY